MAQMMPNIVLSPVGNAAAFRSRMAFTSLGDMQLMAHAATHFRMDIKETIGLQLIFPYIGHASQVCDGVTNVIQSGSNALLVPNLRRTIECAPSSAVVASLDVGRLELTRQAMSGMTADGAIPDDRTVELQLERNRSLFPGFLQICRMIDALGPNAELTANLGIDDMIYRWIAAAMSEPGMQAEQIDARASSHARLDTVCDMIRAASERPMTLTEMEAVSGLSSRALQYGFKARFGCSPMEWQRRERMHAARHRLLTADPDETVTSIAYAMGFSSSAAFSTLYRRYFGEMPSQVLRQFG